MAESFLSSLDWPMEERRLEGSSTFMSKDDVSEIFLLDITGLKKRSCMAITAMKIAGGMRLINSDLRVLVPYFLSPMLWKLHENYIYPMERCQKLAHSLRYMDLDNIAILLLNS